MKRGDSKFARQLTLAESFSRKKSNERANNTSKDLKLSSKKRKFEMNSPRKEEIPAKKPRLTLVETTEEEIHFIGTSKKNERNKKPINDYSNGQRGTKFHENEHHYHRNQASSESKNYNEERKATARTSPSRSNKFNRAKSNAAWINSKETKQQVVSSSPPSKPFRKDNKAHNNKPSENFKRSESSFPSQSGHTNHKNSTNWNRNSTNKNGGNFQRRNSEFLGDKKRNEGYKRPTDKHRSEGQRKEYQHQQQKHHQQQQSPSTATTTKNNDVDRYGKPIQKDNSEFVGRKPDKHRSEWQNKEHQQQQHHQKHQQYQQQKDQKPSSTSTKNNIERYGKPIQKDNPFLKTESNYNKKKNNTNSYSNYKSSKDYNKHKHHQSNSSVKQMRLTDFQKSGNEDDDDDERSIDNAQIISPELPDNYIDHWQVRRTSQ
eukprot:TRINITY_DN6705_c0_g1_i8.p1 TRINITY_DN6705_c0_g1~~TRINITY_DN6705_c0_g1_i8.p1  ORF type:complete len:431 (-),score=127.86 TRINITY_DN6705_c0_g1_i8:330-1622(-)